MFTEKSHKFLITVLISQFAISPSLALILFILPIVCAHIVYSINCKHYRTLCILVSIVSLLSIMQFFVVFFVGYKELTLNNHNIDSHVFALTVLFIIVLFNLGFLYQLYRKLQLNKIMHTGSHDTNQTKDI